MPESEVKRELGGLARSIDALFSQAPPAPVEASAPELLDAVPAPEALAAEPTYAAEPVAPVAIDVPIDPDPFESLEAYEEPAAEPLPLSFADVDVPEEMTWERVEAAGHDGHAAPEPAGAGLEDSVEAYLSGVPGAADEVRTVSTMLRERLALDPVADAVERLVHSGGSAPNDDAVALAQEVINPAVASRLVQRMGHEEDGERRAGYVVLSQRLGMVMAKAFRGALTDSTDTHARRTYFDGLLAMGETSRPVIEAMVEDDNRFLVQNALALLGEMGGDRATELVTSQLANTDARVRCAALGSLAKIGGEDSGQLVLASLEDSDPKVRAAAAEASGELQIERALRPILSLMEDEDDPSVVVPLLNALGRLGDPGAVQAIEKRAVGSLFSKPPTEVRVAAYRALHEIGTPHARELIEKASDDKDPVVRTTVRGLASAE